MRESIFGGVAVAHAAHSAALLDSVRAAFVHGMDLALLVSAGVAAAALLLALLFLPGTRAPVSARSGSPGKTGELAVGT